MTTKALPLDKTLVTEFKSEIADIHLRQRQLKNSIAAKIPQSSNFRTGDFSLITSQQLELNTVTTAIQIHGYEPFMVDLVNGLTYTSFVCNGLFIAFAAFDRVVVRKHLLDTRITYLCA